MILYYIILYYIILYYIILYYIIYSCVLTFKRLLFNFVILTNTTGMSHLKVTNFKQIYPIYQMYNFNTSKLRLAITDIWVHPVALRI